MTYFTLDNLRILYIDNYQPTDLNSTDTLTISENQSIDTDRGEFNATDPDDDSVTLFFGKWARGYA